MSKKIPVSAYVLAFNNRRTIERCLKSLDWVEELVVVDSLSTDGTYEICQRYTEKTYQRHWTGHRDQYQHAADLTTREWILFVDADEEIPLELCREIREELQKGAEGVDAFFVYRRTYYLGRWIQYGGWYPDGEIRLYRRGKGKWEGGLHAKIAVNGKVNTLKNQYLHYTYRNISDQIQTIDKYSQIAAEDMVREGERFSFFKLFFHPPFRFFKEYLLKSGFRDGFPGLVIIVSTMFYVFIKYAKLWELTHSAASTLSVEEEEKKGSSGLTPSRVRPFDQGVEGVETIDRNRPEERQGEKG